MLSLENFVANLKDQSQNISKENLPKEDAQKIIDYCSDKNLPLDKWNRLAIYYYEAKEIPTFIQIMNYLVQKEILKQGVYDSEVDNQNKIQILNSYSAYYLVQASVELSPQAREEYFTSLYQFVNKSDRINVNESISYALKGFLLFYKGEFLQSQVYFNQSRNIDQNCIIAILGIINLEYAKKNYEEALNMYQLAYKLNPNLPIQTLLGVAYCYFNTEKFDLAEKLFQIIRQKDPQNANAVLGLALLQHRQENYQQYCNLLKEAYNLDSQHPILMLYIAEKYIFSNELDKATHAAYLGLQYLKFYPKYLLDLKKPESKNYSNHYLEIKSKLLYIIAFQFHSQNNNEQALKFYKDSVQANPQNHTAQIGLAKILIAEKNYTMALKCFETILEEVVQKQEEIYRTLAYLYSKTNDRNKAIEFYKKALQFDPNDYESWIEYSNLHEHHNMEESLQSYEKALSIMKQLQQQDEDFEISPELYNNIGVLHTKLGNFDKSQINFEEAIRLNQKFISNQDDNTKYKAIMLTIQFNYATMFAEISKFGEASELYKKIIKDNPYYIDAYLRLAFLAYKRGSVQKSLEIIDQAMKYVDAAKFRPDLALCMKGFILNEMGDFNMSRQNFDRLKRSYNLDDSYARVFMLKIDYEYQCGIRDKIDEQKLYLRRISDISREIIHRDENNVQAAMIIGVVMAEMSHFREAKEIFNQLLEFNQNNIQILVNMAHLEFLQQSYENAIRIYDSYLQKIAQPDDYVQMCKVLCYYQLHDFDKALSLMKKIVIKNPENLLHRFNFNVLLQNSAQYVLDQKGRQKEQTQRSIQNMHKVLPMYEHLFKNHHARNSRLGLERSEQGRQIKINLMEKIRDISESKYQIIKANQDHFQTLQIEDDHMLIKRKMDNLLRQKKLQEIKIREEQKKKWKEEQKLEEQKLQEKIAEEQMQKAQEISNLIQSSENVKTLKTKSKGGAKKKKSLKTEKFDDDEEEAFNELFEQNDEDDHNNDLEEENLFVGMDEEEIQKQKMTIKKKKKTSKTLQQSDDQQSDKKSDDLDNFYNFLAKERQPEKKKRKLVKKKLNVNDFAINDGDNNLGKRKQSNQDDEQNTKKVVKKIVDDDDESSQEEIFQEDDKAYDPFQTNYQEQYDYNNNNNNDDDEELML